jgi:hypothetical protein
MKKTLDNTIYWCYIGIVRKEEKVMGKLNKNIYEMKEQYAIHNMDQNKKIGILYGLNENQCNTLDNLCSVRHEMHSNQEDFFIEESPNNSKFYNYIESEINEMLKEARLSVIDFDKIDMLFDTDYYVEADTDEYIEAYNTAIDTAEQINTTIEQYLKNIDVKYCTSYCPTGIARRQI